MARRPSPILTEGEIRLMNVLWRRGRSTVHEVLEGLGPQERLAYTTVLTTLRILERKGFVGHEKEGRAHVYYPVVDRGAARQSALRQLVDRFFDASPEQLVLNLLESKELDADDLQRLRDLMRQKGVDNV